MSLAFGALLVLLASIGLPVREPTAAPVLLQTARIGYDDPAPP